jgi:hypothetical protein
MIDLEGIHLDALHCLDHEVRQIVLRDPVPKIGRKQKGLVPLAVNKLAHAAILTENAPKSDRLLARIIHERAAKGLVSLD